ncbi:MAG: MarR family transcriptional regulator [Candidatus Dormibacteraeota bacterium]|nr:MarR family transcriptional regulator [Candidatus Dormibacteraeota bacterium]
MSELRVKQDIILGLGRGFLLYNSSGVAPIRVWLPPAALADPSCTDQLNHMESAGLITRTVAPENAEGHVVQLTAAGEQLFRRLLRAVVDFDALLRTGFSDQEIGALSRALGQVRSNVA